jgi:hypothetical protein
MSYNWGKALASVFKSKAVKDAVITAAVTKVAGGSDKEIAAAALGTYATGAYGTPSTGTSPTIDPNVATARTSIEKAIEAATNEILRRKLANDVNGVKEMEDQIAILQKQLGQYPTTTGGIPSASGTPDFIKKIGDYFGFGGGSGLEDAYGKDSFFQKPLAEGLPSLSKLALPAFLGKLAYDSAKKKVGGLADTPQVSMDSLGRYQLANALGTGGTREEFGLSPKPVSFDFDAMNQPVAAAGGGLISRQYFSEGGIAELDMREGGESEGPGTGTSDDVPAMLSDGEFVMTAAATKGAGAYDLNKTKKGIELIKTTDSDRERGVTNMRELMNIFEAV